jgi:positive regulator of sigma E activity
MAEREARVIRLAAGSVQLQLLGSACSGCQGGCAGRCSVFATSQDGQLELPVPSGMLLEKGQSLTLRLDDLALRRAAWRGYGIAWLGLLLGAGAGQVLGMVWGQHGNVLVMLGLIVGTFLAVGLSKRPVPEPEILVSRVDSPHPPSSETS